MSDDKKDNRVERVSLNLDKFILDLMKEIHGDVKEVKTRVTEVGAELKLHKQESHSRWDSIAKNDAAQNETLKLVKKDLAQHTARSDRLERDNQLREQKLRAEVFGEGMPDPDKRKNTLVGRIEKLEINRKFFKWLIYITGGILALAKLLDFLI